MPGRRDRIPQPVPKPAVTDQSREGFPARVREPAVPTTRVFLLSPARVGGPRSVMLLRPEANFDLALKLRQGTASLGEVYSFISGLYFRGKVAYSAAFRDGPP